MRTNGGHSFLGILALCTAMVTFVAGDVFMRIVLRGLPVSEGFFLRGLFASAIVLAIILLRGEAGSLRRILSPPSVGRAGFEYFALLAYYAAFLNMPMAEANAIVQMTPLLLVLAVGLVFREPVRPIEYGLVIVGFLGVLIIVRPGAASFSPFGLFALLASTIAIGRDLMSRRVDPTIPPFVVTLTMLAVVGGGMVPGMLVETWRLPQVWELAYIGLAAIAIAAAHLCMYLAFRLDTPPRLAPFFYVALLTSLISGAVIFGERPDSWSLAGMALIAVSGVVALRRRAPA